MSLWWRFSSFPVETVLSQYAGSVVISSTKQLNHCPDLKCSCRPTGTLWTTAFFAGQKYSSLPPLLRLSAHSFIPRELFYSSSSKLQTMQPQMPLPSQKRYVPIFQIPQSFFNRLLVWKGCQLQQPKTQQCRPQHSKFPLTTLSMHKGAWRLKS